jgi:hypothetical protein
MFCLLPAGWWMCCWASRTFISVSSFYIVFQFDQQHKLYSIVNYNIMLLLIFQLLKYPNLILLCNFRLNPRPHVLLSHFFAVAFYAIYFTFRSEGFLYMHRAARLSCGIFYKAIQVITPLVWSEAKTIVRYWLLYFLVEIHHLGYNPRFYSIFIFFFSPNFVLTVQNKFSNFSFSSIDEFFFINLTLWIMMIFNYIYPYLTI